MFANLVGLTVGNVFGRYSNLGVKASSFLGGFDFVFSSSSAEKSLLDA